MSPFNAEGVTLMIKDDMIVGAKAAAEFCGLSTRLIYAMCDRGELPVIRSGKRRLLFRKSELERALTGNAEAA